MVVNYIFYCFLKLASKVELFVGDSPPSTSSQANKLDNIHFTRLGLVTLHIIAQA